MTPEELTPEERVSKFMFGHLHEDGVIQKTGGCLTCKMINAIRVAVAEEREACAKIADEMPVESGEKRRVTATIADAIRARGA